MSEVDDVIAAARASWDRIAADRGGGGAAPRGSGARPGTLARKVGAIAIADGGILFLALAIGLVIPLGMTGFILILVALVAMTALIAAWPAPRAPRAEQLRSTNLKALPGQAEQWLQAQRPALPAPAVTLVDQIGVRLDALRPQLAELEPGAPAGEEVRKLVAEQLPAFVRDYQRVPQGLRSVAHNGATPDAQLVEGLKVIERRLGEASQQIAQGDLDALSTRGRFLELKYSGDQAG